MADPLTPTKSHAGNLQPHSPTGLNLIGRFWCRKGDGLGGPVANRFLLCEVSQRLFFLCSALVGLQKLGGDQDGENGSVYQTIEAFEKQFCETWLVSKNHIPVNYSQIERFVRCGLDKFVIGTSTLVMFVGLLYLQLRIDRHSARSLHQVMDKTMSFGLSASPLDGQSWLEVGMIIWLCPDSGWFNTVSGIFASTQRIRRNRDQLLIFSFMSSMDVDHLTAERGGLRNLLETSIKDQNQDHVEKNLVLERLESLVEAGEVDKPWTFFTQVPEVPGMPPPSMVPCMAPGMAPGRAGWHGP